MSSLKKLAKKPLDRLFEYLRFVKVKPYIQRGASLLDIGAGDGSFLKSLEGHIQYGLGIDPILPSTTEYEYYTLVKGCFPDDFQDAGPFDVITLLAVIEHIPEGTLDKVIRACWDVLVPGGTVIITVPHPNVDHILAVLKFLRIIHGLSLDEHYGFNPKDLPKLFKGWHLEKKERWEFGCNYLFIFKKP